MVEPDNMKDGYVVLPVKAYNELKRKELLNDKLVEAIMGTIYDMDESGLFVYNMEEAKQIFKTMYPNAIAKRQEEIKKKKSHERMSAARKATMEKKKQEGQQCE